MPEGDLNLPRLGDAAREIQAKDDAFLAALKASRARKVTNKDWDRQDKRIAELERRLGAVVGAANKVIERQNEKIADLRHELETHRGAILLLQSKSPGRRVTPARHRRDGLDDELERGLYD